MNRTSPTLRIENLTISYRYGEQWLDAVRDVSFQIEPGQTYGLVGESGSGKTTLAKAIMCYLSEYGQVRDGRIEFEGTDLLSLSRDEMRHFWGAQMGMVPQNPLSSLNPSIRIGEQLAETIRHHAGLSQNAAQVRVLEMLRSVRLADPARVAASYPHQISGGMQQRILIAMALSTTPHLLVLDEPTTSLDVTTQATILDLFRDLIKDSQAAVLYVSHNLSVIAQICDRVAVLYAGELVEDASIDNLFNQPLHPYTQGLLDSVPRLGQNKHQGNLHAIYGQIPALGERPAGCVFRPRCPIAIEVCQERPLLSTITREDRSVRCHRWSEIASGQVNAKVAHPQDYATNVPGRLPVTLQEKMERAEIQMAPIAKGDVQSPSPKELPVLKMDNLAVHFSVHRSIGDTIAGRAEVRNRAVDDISLVIQQGQTLGLVGESGSGKTSLARAVVGLVERNGGKIGLLGVPLPPRLSGRSLDTLRHLQMVFQNPEEALNPYMTVGDSLRRSLIKLLGTSNQEADEGVKRLLNAVSLPAEYSERMPGQLSGGEKQRIAIARAFASHPDLLIADEPVSSLDVSVQASILNMLNQLQLNHGTAMLFISHDLAVVGFLADTIAVVYMGRLMELAPAKELFMPPYHPYTEALLAAIPLMQPGYQRDGIRLEEDLSSPMEISTGCPFYSRCPRNIGRVCLEQEPPRRHDEETGKQFYCHLAPDELNSVQKIMIPT